jgi:hypothetical protein
MKRIHGLLGLVGIWVVTAFAGAEPTLVIDTMEDLSAWRTGGQKEATLQPESGLVAEGKQALRFAVTIDHKADEAIAGKQYPKGWPRIERNPEPPLDLSAAGGISFSVYTLSSRAVMPGSSLQIILRDKGGNDWSANLGELPLKQWKQFRLDFPVNFQRRAICHWQFYLSESDYGDGDQVTFIIDDVQGYAAQASRRLAPRLQARLALLQRLAGADVAAVQGLAAEVGQAQADVVGIERLDLAACNAFDAHCAELLGRLQAMLLAAGARQTAPGGAYCVGTETSLRKVLRDDLDFTPATELRLSLAGNERESGQLVVRPMTRDISRLSASWTDLIGPGGASLPKAQIRLDAVAYVEVLKASYARDREGWWPDPLVPLDWLGSGKAGLGPLAGAFAKVGESQPLWVTVRCPAGQPPGAYTGTITLKPEGLPESTVTLTVQVRSFSLPLRPRLKTAFAFFEGEYRNYYKRPMTDPERRATEEFMLEHKLNPMNLYTPFAWPGLTDLEFMRSRGLNAYCLGYCPGTVKDFGELVYYRYLRDYRAWLAARGLDRDAWLYGYDEPHCRPDWEELKGVMRDVYALVDAVAPGLPKASTTAIVPELRGAVNLWIPQTMQVVRADTLAAQERGEQVWTYVACTPTHPFANYFVEYAALEPRLLGWQTWQEGCTGFLYYATNLWRPNYEGLEPRWPELPWNPRPAKDFAFNGDGLLVYPHPDGSLLSTVRLEAICDGIEDYDYLCLLRDASAALKAAGASAELVRQAEAAVLVPPAVSVALTDFNHDPTALLAQRETVAALLEKAKAALPAAAWQAVLAGEPPLAPAAPLLQAAHVALPYTCDFDGSAEKLALFTSAAPGKVSATVRAVEGARGQAAVSDGLSKGWVDWESPYLTVAPGQTLAVRLAVKAQYSRGLVRVFLAKYGANERPLDLPTRPQGDYGPALLGALPNSADWEKHRYLVKLPAGVQSVRLHLQAFDLEGSVAWDEVSVALFVADPASLDDLDEVGNWRPNFPESAVARETKIVHQGDAALRYTVTVNHRGGEEKYPIGWPSLTWTPSPALDLNGKQALTFWAYATSTRATLPPRAVTFSLRSQPGDSLSVPLTFPLNAWQQVRIPLAGKQWGAVNYLHFFVDEAAYLDQDQVSFVLDDLRLE